MPPSERKRSFPKIVAIGGGNMASAIIEGSLRSGALTAQDWAVAEPDAGRRARFAMLEIEAVASAGDLGPMLSGGAQVLLAVKPQMLGAVAQDAAGLSWDRVVISILAGIPSARIRTALGGEARVIRVMPNTPAQIGQGATGVALGAGAEAGDEALAMRIFHGVGPVVERIDEALMDAFTAVAGSGPAYLFYLAESMTRAAIELGFEKQVADRIVRQTLLGASELLAGEPGSSAESLRAAVTSKGGTTAAATTSLDASGVNDAVVRALTAARDRGRELGGT